MSVIALDFYSEDDPNGTALGTLDDADCKKIKVRVALHEPGYGQLVISRHHAEATSALLTHNNLVKVRIPSVDTDPIFAFWLKDGDFTLISSKEQGGEDLTFGGPGILAMLADARLYHSSLVSDQPARGSLDVRGKWTWINEPYGAILTRIMEEGREAPYPDAATNGSAFEHVSITFDRTDDSDSVAWPNITETFEERIGTDMLRVAERLRESGNLVYRMDPDLTMHAHQSYGRDLSGAFGAGTVRFEKGVNILTELRRKINARLDYTHLILEDSDGNFSTEVAPGWTAAERKHWGYHAAGQTNDDTLLNAIGAEVIRRSVTPQIDEMELEWAPGFDPANGRYMPGPEGTSGHVWVGDTITLHTGSGEHDYNAADQLVTAIRIVLDEAADDATSDTAARSLHLVAELNHETVRDGRDAEPGVGPRPPTPPSTSGGGTLRLYPSAHLAGDDDTAQSLAAPNLVGADSGSDGDYISTWAARETGEAEWYMMYAEPQDSVSASAMNWAATNDGAAYYPIGAFMVKIGSGTDDPDGRILSIVQAGGSMKVQVQCRSRYGTGISEGAQNHLLAAAARVYRPGSGFVGTAFSVSTIGDLKFPAQATRVNRSGTATLAAVAGAADGDYLCVEFGIQHLGPTSGGTGAVLGWTDTADTDLPEDQVTTTVLNSWVELTGSGTSSGDTPNPTVLPGDEDFGDADCYAPCGHTHAAGQLSSDGEHFFDASGIEYDGGESGLSATDVQQAIDALAAGAAAGQVSEHGALGTTEEFDASEADGHSGTLDDDLTVTLAGATDGEESWLTLYLTDDGGGPYDITWPDSVSWPGGVEPDSPPAGQTLVVTLVSIDGGTTWYGSYPGTGSATTSANFFTVDPGTPTYDDTSGVEVSLTSKFGIDSNGDPYFNEAGVTSGEEAALMRDSENGSYFLRPYNF